MAQATDSRRHLPGSDELAYSDGEPMESARHVAQLDLLIDSLLHAWRDRDDFYVAGNMFVYFSETQTRKNDFRGPDVFVVMNTSRRERKSWVVWEEGGRGPDVVIELLSESTEHVDRGEKMRVYAQVLRVPEYFLFDPFKGVLEGYELDAARGAYRAKVPDTSGRFPVTQMALYLGTAPSIYRNIEAVWLRWMDEAGPLPLPVEALAEAAKRIDTETARADAEAERADAETKRADAETKRAECLFAELQRLRGERRD